MVRINEWTTVGRRYCCRKESGLAFRERLTFGCKAQCLSSVQDSKQKAVLAPGSPLCVRKRRRVAVRRASMSVPGSSTSVGDSSCKRVAEFPRYDRQKVGNIGLKTQGQCCNHDEAASVDCQCGSKAAAESRHRTEGAHARCPKPSEQMFGSLRKVRLDAACAFHSDTTPVVPTSADIVTTMSAQSRWRY